VARAQGDPAWWIGEVLQADLWEKQAQIAESVRDNPSTAIRSCHGPGKSFISARIALWFLHCFRDSLMITTAPTWYQVSDIIWKEIRIARR
jgi:phage terminase large subunit